MPLDHDQKKAIRHMTKQYLCTVGSSQRLLAYAAGSARRSPDTRFIGDGLFAWWDAFMNPSHPEMADFFSQRELESLRRYDTVIRGFHETSEDRQLPIQDFMRTNKFQEISDAARDCHKVFRRFWFFHAAHQRIGKDRGAKTRLALAAPLAVLLAGGFSLEAADARFTFSQTPDQLAIKYAGQPVATYVFRDDKILRPYFANVHALSGVKVTRNHPPVAGSDATDHDTMHPGLWLGFGDISGQDFWRNKGRIEHVRFTTTPRTAPDRFTFATESRLLTSDGKPLCSLTNDFTLTWWTNAWLLVWDATFRSEAGDFTFGDQEEMGFGARVATAITEKNGGVITSSTDERSAARTWGKTYDWCDYSGMVEGRPVGIMLMPDPANFRPSWWHNRNYGVFVANPFGREAMKQGGKSAVTVKRGESFRLRFGAVIHAAAVAEDRAGFQRELLAEFARQPQR